MRVSVPLWLNSPIVSWVPCRVVGELQAEGFVVEVSVGDAERSIVVPREYVRGLTGASLPASAELRIIVIAELTDDDRMLAELPSTPLNGSQRILGTPAALKVA